MVTGKQAFFPRIVKNSYQRLSISSPCASIISRNGHRPRHACWNLQATKKEFAGPNMKGYEGSEGFFSKNAKKHINHLRFFDLAWHCLSRKSPGITESV
jgi:hypothetical protein